MDILHTDLSKVKDFNDVESDEEIEYSPEDLEDFNPAEEFASHNPKTFGLYEDPTFPPEKMLGSPSNGIKFLRPIEICQNPKMFVSGGDRFDIRQGTLGDCWFLSALSTITLKKELLTKICPDQTFDKNQGYTGKFTFYFYQYGEFVKVEIDDRLPCQGFSGSLLFCQSNTPNEFWPALLEKAYAKLNGNYENLVGGVASEAMVDLTGGILELYELNSRDFKMSDTECCQMMYNAIDNHALCSAAIVNTSKARESMRSDGLMSGHAYSITGMRHPDSKFNMPMIRLRNPWGAVEWNGPGSDKDPRWGAAGSDGDYNTENDEDGEFYMPFGDFMKIFTKIEICRLAANDIKSEGRWEEKSMAGEWSISKGTAGGCGNYRQSHHGCRRG